MTENSRRGKLPTRPSSPSGRDFENNEKSNDYYLKTQAAAALERYKGRGKGLEVFLSRNDVARLDALKEIFGRDFGLNNIICAADYFLDRENVQENFGHGLPNEDCGEVMRFKPNTSSMLAILKHGKENSATFLLKLGIELLSLRLGGRG
jgi:hypothetical protein